jgi:8-oxo-dGTP pyrophosphatase MutT (NUDIX family)
MTVLFRKAVAAVEPRPAATTLILRDSSAGLEVLMVRRSLQASFMPGAHVFPGGAVDAADGAPAHVAVCDEPAETLTRRIGAVTQVGALAAAYAVAALRECFEECGLWLGAPDPAACDWAALRARRLAGETLATLSATAGWPLATSALQPWSHWVTPVGLPKRFDTLFFVTRAPAGQVPEVDAGETTTLAWVHPPAALAAYSRGEFPMEFATVRNLESMDTFATAKVEELLAHAASCNHLPPVQPRLQLDAERNIVGVLLPGQQGYDTALAGH